MKKLFIVLVIILCVMILAIGGILTYVATALPDANTTPNIEIERTAERVERGEYLANNVMVCMHCHTPQDKAKFAHPMKKDSLGAGGVLFGAEEGFPGNYYSPNLTPANLGDWTDGEIYRAIAEGVNKDGKALFPIMPHPVYGNLEKEDLYSVIAYLRTLEPIENEVPESESFFPMNFIINTIPQPAEHTMVKDTTDPVAWGKYLVASASCADCHTPMEQGEFILGMEFAGGMEFPMIDGSIVRTANISPDTKTGIGSWGEEQFVQRFKAYADTSFKYNVIPNGQFNTAMPWQQYSKMSEEELKAIYAYLRSVNPIENLVTRFTPVSE